MTPDEIKVLIEQGIPGAEVEVRGDGGKFEVRVVAPAFAGLMPVRKQQLVYSCLNEQIASGAIHAVTMQTLTPEEWDKARRLGTL